MATYIGHMTPPEHRSIRYSRQGKRHRYNGGTSSDREHDTFSSSQESEHFSSQEKEWPGKKIHRHRKHKRRTMTEKSGAEERDRSETKKVQNPEKTRHGLRGDVEFPLQTAILFSQRVDDDVRLRRVKRRMLRGKARDVFLKVYDITDGRASQWLKPLMGTQIEGIWHTGVVVYGKEHFYCDGIQSLLPDVVELKFSMQLRDILYLGKTSLSRTKVQAILRHCEHGFTPELYDLIKWNCNHFTESFLASLFPKPKPLKPSSVKKFGQSPPRLPLYVAEQPDQFLATARGRILVWMVKNVLEKIDNFLNDRFQAGLDNIIDRWFRVRE